MQAEEKPKDTNDVPNWFDLLRLAIASHIPPWQLTHLTIEQIRKLMREHYL